jgi:hypothetical protein
MEGTGVERIGVEWKDREGEGLKEEKEHNGDNWRVKRALPRFSLRICTRDQNVIHHIQI